VTWWQIAALLATALVAGGVDAIVGGGGLIQLPVLLLVVPTAPVASALGTNKLSSIAGTTTAATTYLGHTRVSWRILGPGVVFAASASGVGAWLAGAVPATLYRPIVLAVLVVVAAVVLLRPQLGVVAVPQASSTARTVAAIASITGLALYDGAVGPGTGTFLILVFTGLLGVDFLHSSAMGKVVNVATNLGALVVFAVAGHVLWLLGAAMGVCNMAGARLGARVALRRGARFVRLMLLAVVTALLLRLGYQQFA
jgi:uncharacterized membrane protein YfcA